MLLGETGTSPETAHAPTAPFPGQRDCITSACLKLIDPMSGVADTKWIDANEFWMGGSPGVVGVSEYGVTVLSKELDEKVARLHLAKFGVNLTELSQEQADYIDVKVEGPYKPSHYRY